MGKCEDERETYLGSLSRKAEWCKDVPPIHIYFKKLPVEVHNLSVLTALPGSKQTFESIDCGNAQSLNNTVPTVL